MPKNHSTMPLTLPLAGREEYVIEAVDRALQMLEVLGEQPSLGVTEIARRMQVSKTLAFRLLHTLERWDYVTRDAEHRTASLGYRLLHLAKRATDHSTILRSTRAEMDDLAARVDEDINLYVRIGPYSVCVANRRSRHTLHQAAEPGRRGLLHAGGSSSVLLAFAPPDIQEAVLAGELKRFTPQTLVDPRRLRLRIRKIQEDGVHVARGDVNAVGFSVAAPIFGPGGLAVASLSIAGMLSRLTPELEAQYCALVTEAAIRMSAELGGFTRAATADAV